MHLIYAKMLAKNVECSTYFTALQDINNLETQKSYKTTVNLRNLNFFKKNLSAVFKLFAHLFK